MLLRAQRKLLTRSFQGPRYPCYMEPPWRMHIYLRMVSVLAGITDSSTCRMHIHLSESLPGEPSSVQGASNNSHL